MSIKGTTKELYVGKTESNIIDRKHNKTKIEYDKLRHIEHMVYIGGNGGWLKFSPKEGESVLFEFPEDSKSKIIMAINLIEQNNPDLKIINVPSEKPNTSKILKSALRLIWNKTWGELGILSKILFILWSIYSITAINSVGVFRWFIIWIFATIIFFISARIYHIKKEKERIAKEEWQRKLQHQLEIEQYYNSMKELENSFVSFFKERYYVDVNVIDIKRIVQGVELIVFTKNKSQLEYILSKKQEIKNSYTMNIDFETLYDSTFKVKIWEGEKIEKDYTEISQTLNYDNMEGHDFEYFCAEILKKNDYKNVEVTQGSGDQGIDIIAYKDGVKYGIQCKCYSSDIGNKAVQEAFSGSKFYDCHVPVVLTNRFFTKSAKELAQKNNVLLWDRDYLDKLIESADSDSE